MNDKATTLRVSGMDCADEVVAVERALKAIGGIREVRVNLMGGKVTIAHEQAVPVSLLIQAIAKEGLTASPDEPEADYAKGGQQQSRLVATICSGGLTFLGLVLRWIGAVPPKLNIVIFACAIVAGGWFIFPKFLAALRRYSLDMNVLMTVAVIGAAAIGEWNEGATVVFLFALSELLESYSVSRARRAIQALLDISPETAWLQEGNTFREVPVEQVRIGNIIAIKSGARLPLDGEVIRGASAVNQAPITGESMPVEKGPGDPVFAGTINGEGSLEVRVTKAYSDTTLSRIIRLVEEAQSQKSPSQKFVDKFARIYTPAVFLFALLVWLVPPLMFHAPWHVWTYRALVMLVVACPCALVISTPVSVVSGLTAMARRGVLIKGGTFLEAIGKLRVLAVDKTGTITEGHPRVTKVILFNSKSTGEMIRVAASIDAHSDHPIAQAIAAYAREQNIEFSRCDNYQSRNGRGAEGEIDGHHYFVGNHRFAHELAVCSDALEKTLAEIESEAQSVVVVGHKPHDNCTGDILAVLAIGDTIRPNAADAIRSLHNAGLQKVVMLSGDNQRTVDAIARQAGISEAYGNLLPEQKIEYLRNLTLRYRYVGMIGDGVNDAPAMAAASVGIAMGAAGTDVAIEAADIALMQDDLSKVAETVHLGRRTVRIIQANIVFALLVKAVFLVLAFAGYTSLWLAILADTGASLVVIANGLRLLRPDAK